MSPFKPAGPHNPRLGPATCLCVDCSRIVLDLRCPATDADGNQCGDYRHRGKSHTLLVCTTFEIAAARVAAAQEAS